MRVPSRTHARELAFAIAAALAPALSACSTSDSPSPAPLVDASGTAAPTLCSNEPRAEAYRAGLEHTGAAGRFKVKLLNVTPNPVTHGDNRWNIAVSDSAGTPVAGATLVLEPFLVDHGKPAAQTPVAAADPLPGQHTVSRIDLPIAGVWKFTFNVTAKGENDQVVFTFCIDE